VHLAARQPLNIYLQANHIHVHSVWLQLLEGQIPKFRSRASHSAGAAEWCVVTTPSDSSSPGELCTDNPDLQESEAATYPDQRATRAPSPATLRRISPRPPL
jgi:hypothetical protein